MTDVKPLTAEELDEFRPQVGMGWPHWPSSRIARMLATIDALTAENAELNARFDLRFKADARAIQMWRETTGQDHASPDQADLCVHLMMRLDMADQQIAALTAERDALREALEEIADFPFVGGMATLKVQDIARAALAKAGGGE